MTIKIVIFDLDGTILNTLEDLTDSTNYALRVNGYSERTIDEVRSFVGNGIAKLINRALPDETDSIIEAKVLDDFSTYYAKHCADKTRPYDGIEELIKELRTSGVKTAVVSNKADFAVQQLCKDYFPDMFDYVVGEKKNIRRKPAPDTVLEVTKKLGVNICDAVYVGDSEIDIMTGINAKMDVISVTWGFRDKEYLIENGAVTLVDNPFEITGKLV